jgi:hypothetical protein
MIDDCVSLAAHLPCIAIVPTWKDEGKIVGKLIGPAAIDAFHDLVV